MSDSDDSVVLSDSGSDFEEPKKKKAKSSPKKAPAPKKVAPVFKQNGGGSKSTPKKEKKTTPKKQKENVPNGDAEDDAMDVFFNIDKPHKRLSIEKIYQKKSQLEHILLRPDTYIGSIEYTEPEEMWVLDMEEKKLVQRKISYVPGLYKIFDEILVNAADNKQRDLKMKYIKVSINKAKNEISIMNDGKGIPVVEHKEEKMFVPEMIFGTLLTSSNYNDDERKVTGGRNGYGAKLCNIFSTKFTVETASKEYKKRFKQTWINNMTKDEEPEILPLLPGESEFTKITFKPDLAKFKMTELDDDIISFMARRAYDVAGTTGIKVYLNGEVVPCTGFQEYVKQYTNFNIDPSTDNPYPVAFETVNDRWQIAVTVSERGLQQVSFVNSIATIKGGRHVDYVLDNIISKIIDNVKAKVVGKGKDAKKTGFNLKPFQVKNHMWVFVNALIENPTFDSQTKETMTLQAKSFGSKCEPSDKFLQSTLKTGITDAVASWVKFKEQEAADKKCSSKKSAKIKGLPKLEDANDAGTKNSHLCTLILTEGDSAKSLAVAGLGVIGRDRYGVFPLRGKMLNVREAAQKQVNENAEISAMLKIFGLQFRLKYDKEEEMKTLRYGKMMIMTDQDQDGSHIKGLVINFIHHYWPNLIKNNFVEEFITPIVKATKGNQEHSFFSIPEYVEWRQNTENWKSFKIKYYKGLGTSTSKEAKEYFTDMKRHLIKFKYSGGDDDQAVELAFSKKKVEERKHWLTNWMEIRKERRLQGQTDDILYDKETRAITFSDFINKELILFSNTDNERSIPSLVDGLKPGQRKVLFTCFHRADKKEVKVAQLAGAVGEKSAYHHGEQSLMMTIINLAQDFTGANNINLLLPIGQFGTRLQGGKDAASPRYIFTMLNPVTRTLFPKDDDNVLRFLYEENQRIEPEWYCPIIPTVLVNGAEGIGTGWSTNVPNFNPRDLVENIRRLIRGQEMKPMVPWYKNYRGSIVPLDDSRFVCSGEVSNVNDETIEITELPIKVWTQKYKESVIEPMLDGSEKAKYSISDFKEYHTEQTVKFLVKMPADKLRQYEREGLHNVFKLQNAINTTSMVLFDAAGVLRKFNSVLDILREFYEVRKKIYVERKRFLEGRLSADSDRLSEQARFILMKIKGEIHIENKKKAAIVQQLVQHNFKPDPVKKFEEMRKKKELEQNGEVAIEEEDEDETEEATEVEKKVKDYDYLVSMAILKLSMEEKDKLLAASEAKKEELRILQTKSWSDLWEADLDVFMEALTKQEKKERDDIENVIKKTASGFKEDGKKKTKGTSADQFKPNPNAIRIAPTIDHMQAKYATKETKPKVERKKKNEGMDMRQFLEKKEGSNSLNGAENDFDNDISNDGEIQILKNGDDLDDDDILETKPSVKPKAEPKEKKPRVKKEKEEKPKKEKAAPKVKKETKPKKKVESESDDDVIISDSEDEFRVKEEKPKKAAAPKVKKENKPKRKVESESDDDVHISESEEDFALDGTPPPRERPTRARAAQPKSYKIDDLDENSDDDFEPQPKKTKVNRIDSDDDIYAES